MTEVGGVAGERASTAVVGGLLVVSMALWTGAISSWERTKAVATAQAINGAATGPAVAEPAAPGVAPTATRVTKVAVAEPVAKVAVAEPVAAVAEPVAKVAVAEPVPAKVAEPVPAKVAEPVPAKVAEPVPAKAVAVGCTSMHVLFAASFHTPTKAERDRVDGLARWLRQTPEVKVVARGHADGTGGMTSNLSLSHRRAAWVRRRLLSEGVEPERVSMQALGAYDPLEGVPRESGLQRRVEIMFRNADRCPDGEWTGMTEVVNP